MKFKIAAALVLVTAIGFTIIASSPKSSHQEMIEMLQQLNKKNTNMAPTRLTPK
jgi:hypothetical protein